jgi:hypothetical protein
VDYVNDYLHLDSPFAGAHSYHRNEGLCLPLYAPFLLWGLKKSVGGMHILSSLHVFPFDAPFFSATGDWPSPRVPAFIAQYWISRLLA